METDPIVIDEVVNLEMETQDAKVERAEFAFVVFHNLAETYPEDADLTFQYTLTPDLVPTTRDWVGLYKVGWMLPRDYLYYEWATIPANYKAGCEADATVTFPAQQLPKDDGEFYQLCYVSSSSQIRGASTPFQFRRPGSEDFVEVEDEETNMLVIRSKTAFLEENLQRAETQKIKLTETLEHVLRERDGVVSKHAELVKRLAVKESHNSELAGQLVVQASNLEQLKKEAKDMILVRDELEKKIDRLKQEHSNLQNTIEELTTKLTKMTSTQKELEAERDRLSGANANLEDQVAMYKQHLETSENAAKTMNVESEELQIKLAQMESLIEHLKETVENLSKELEENRMNLDQQTAAHKDNLAEMEEKLKNAEDKLSAAADCRAILQKEIASYQETQKELSKQIEKSKSECENVKHKLCALEEDFTKKNMILQAEMEQTRSDLLQAIQEKERLQGENSSLTQKLSTRPEVNVSSVSVMKQSLNQIKERLEKKEKHCKNLEKSLTNKQTEFLSLERDLRREAEDLKEKVMMCSEEYKALYIEKSKLQRKVDKLAKKKGKPGRMCESAVDTEVRMMTSTPLTCASPQDEDNINLEPLKQEIDRQVDDWGREMEKGLKTKQKYKTQYRQERDKRLILEEKFNTVVKEKEEEIRRLKQRLNEMPSNHDLKVRTLEKCVAEKQQEIDLLNSKLRQCNQSRNDEAGASTVPSRSGAMSPESKYPYPVYSPVFSHDPSRSGMGPYSPIMVYPQQAPLQYPQHPLNGQIPNGAVPMQMPYPFQYPAHNTGNQMPINQHLRLPDRQPIQRVYTDSMYPEVQKGDILDTAEKEEHQLDQPLTPLPAPLTPEVLPSAKVAAVKSSLGRDERDGEAISDFISDTDLKVALPSVPVTIPSAPPAAGEKEDRFYDAEGTSMKLCALCQKSFSVDVDDATFDEHVLTHFVGQTCPICFMERHEDMTDDLFNKHVNAHMDNDNNNDGVV